MQNLPRRVVMLAGSSLALAGQMAPGVAQVASADADLVSACAEALAIDRHCDTICDAVEHLPFRHPQSLAVMDECHGLMPRFHAAVARAAALPATTLEGRRVKAEVVLGYLRNDANSADIALSLARDLLGSAEL
ncbi:MAG: hypothetical protein ACRYG8_39290 [Janthinobacterium lividum]